MPQSKYDNYGGESDGSSGGYDNVELRFETYATIYGELNRAFGASNEYGQSLGLNFENVRLQDGLIYYYPDKDRYKMFPWKQVAGFMPGEMAERDGIEASIDAQADEVYTENYGGDTQTYELVAVRMPEVVDDDGTVLVEAQSQSRAVSMVNGTPEFTEWEDLGGDVVPFNDTITWWDGSDDYGPSTSSVVLLETLTHFSEDSAVDEDDVFNWLPDTSGDNILRDDLQGRDVEFFTIMKHGENRNYKLPVILDRQTGERIRPNNRGSAPQASSSNDGGSGGAESQLNAAREADAEARDYPEPVADFIEAGNAISLDRESAEGLLDDVLSSDTSLDEEMLEEVGGREHVIQAVL